MKKFIESLRMYNGEVSLIALHQRRFDLTRLAHFGRLPRIDLAKAIAAFLREQPTLEAQVLYKLRVVYDREIESVVAEPYKRREITSVSLVSAPNLDYRFKYADRSALNLLRGQVPAYDEPLIVQNGFITDAIYANVCLYDGTLWQTPAAPLLAGVARQAAIAAGALTEARLTASDFEARRFTKLKLINCMNRFDEAAEVLL